MGYPREELAKVHAEVEQSIREKSAARFAALYTESGTLFLPDGQVVRGRPQIERAFAEWLDGGFVDQKVEVVEFDSAERLAVEEGRAAGTFRGENGDTVVHSTYVIVHKLDVDGVWRMHQDIWTSVPSPAG